MVDLAVEAGRPADVLVFWIGVQLYAVPLDVVGEMLNVERVTRIPFAPRAIEGLITVRGEAVPLIDLVALLGLGAEAPPWESKAISLRDDDGIRAALRVGAVHRIQSTREQDWRSPNVAHDHPAVRGYLIIDPSSGETAIVLSAERIHRALDELTFSRGQS